MSEILTANPSDQRTRVRLTEDILKAMTLTMRSRGLYPEDHPLLRLSAEKVVALLRDYFAIEPAWTIVLIGGEFVYEKVPLAKLTAQVTPLLRLLNQRQIQSLTIRSNVMLEEIISFFTLVLSTHELWSRGGDPTAALVGAGVKNMLIQRVEVARGGVEVSMDTDEARDIYSSLKHALKTFGLSLVDGRRNVSLDLINQLRDRLILAMETNHFAVASRIHTRHQPEDLFAHCINTAIIAYLAARSMGISPGLLPDIVTAGLLHDIGLMDIPPRIKDGVVLMSDDSRIYLEHPIRGLGILRSIPGVPLLAEIAVFEHHRQNNGEGFPQSPERKSMGAAAAIISMASAFDSLMHGAAYTPPEDIPLRLIKMAGSDFDAHILAHFLVALGMYPPGTYVKLTTNEVALVVDSSRGDVFRPTIKVLKDARGKDVADGAQIDLTDRDPETGGYYTSIVGSMSQI